MLFSGGKLLGVSQDGIFEKPVCLSIGVYSLQVVGDWLSNYSRWTGGWSHWIAYYNL